MALPEASGTTGTTAVPLNDAGTHTEGCAGAPLPTPIRYPAMLLSPAGGASVTAAAWPTTADAGGAGTISPVASARSVLVTPALPGPLLSTVNGQDAPNAPTSVPSEPRTVQEYELPSVNAAAGTV